MSSSLEMLNISSSTTTLEVLLGVQGPRRLSFAGRL